MSQNLKHYYYYILWLPFVNKQKLSSLCKCGFHENGPLGWRRAGVSYSLFLFCLFVFISQ